MNKKPISNKSSNFQEGIFQTFPVFPNMGLAAAQAPADMELGPGTYWLTRVVFLRYLGFIYLVAFLISFHQNKELIGSRGLTPASTYLLNSECTDSHHTMHHYPMYPQSVPVCRMPTAG